MQDGEGRLFSNRTSGPSNFSSIRTVRNTLILPQDKGKEETRLRRPWVLPVTMHRTSKERDVPGSWRGQPVPLQLPDSPGRPPHRTALASAPAKLSTSDKALISTDRAGGQQRVPSLVLPGLSNVLKKGEGPNRMGVSLRGHVCGELNREERMGMRRSAYTRVSSVLWD